MKAMNNGGYLSFWWPRHGYWNSYSVQVREVSVAGTTKNTVTSIVNSPEPVGSKKVTIDLEDPGKVLQVQTFAFTGLGNVTTTSISDVLVSGWTASFTKKRSNSKLVCQLKWYNYYATDTATYFWLSAYVNGVNVTSSSTASNIWENGTISTHNSDQFVWKAGAHQEFFTHFWDEQNTAVANMTFKIKQSTAGQLTIWNSGIPQLVITEVAQ